MKRHMKWMAVIASLMLAFCVTATAYASMTQDEYREYLEGLLQEITTGQGNYPQPAKIERVSDELLDFAPGEARTLNVTVKNIGDRAAKDVRVSVSLGGADTPITAELDSRSQTLSNVGKSAERNLSINVRASNTAKEGVYTLTLRFTYRDNKNEIVEDTDNVYIRVTGGTSTPELVVRDFSASGGRATAGEGFTLAAVLQNVGDADAREIHVTVEGFDASSVYLSGSSNNQYFSSLKSGAIQNMSLSLGTHKDIKSGSYPLTFKLRYRDGNNNEKTNEYVYYVNVQSASSEDRANLEMMQMPTLSGTYDVGQVFGVAFEVANIGIESAKNIKVTATTDGTAIVPRSQDTRSLAQLAPGAKASFSFSFAATSDAATRNYAISFKVEYENGLEGDDGPEVDSFEQFVGVNIDNPDSDDDEEEKVRIPKIIIDNYKVNPIIVSAGQEFDISMVFRNTHPDKSIENIKVILTPLEPTEDSSSPFMPVDGSNTFYISDIAPGGTSTKDFRMYAIPNAEPRAYTIRVDFQYQDPDFNEYTADEIIGVTVKQTTKLDTGNIMVPTEGFMFQPVYVNFNLMNTGKSTLHNLSVDIKGDGFDVSKSFMYFGSLNKSGSSYYDGEITPQQPGQQSGVVIITYEDEAGEVTTIERDFVMNIMDMNAGMDEFGGEMPANGFPVEMEGTGGGWQSYAKNPWVWAGVVALGIAAFVGKKIYDKKKRPQYDE